MKKTLRIIVAIGKDGVIGKEGKLPWKHKTDLSRFYANSKDKPILMGRNSYSELTKPIGTKENFVVTSKGIYREDFHEVSTIEEFLRWFDTSEYREAVIAGGMKVYRDIMNLNSNKYRIIVQLHMLDIECLDCDKKFPVEELYDVFKIKNIEFVEVKSTEPSLTILEFERL